MRSMALWKILWILFCRMFTCSLRDAGGTQTGRAVALQVTLFQAFETSTPKFNKFVAIPAASLRNKGFPQNATFVAVKTDPAQARGIGPNFA